MSFAKKLLPSCSLLVLCLASAAQAEPRKPTHVACVGDSITAGAGASETSKNYVSQLQTMLGNGVQVKNFGRSGATMLSEGFGDLPYTKQVEYTNATTFVDGAGPTAVVSVVIILGANDSKPFNWEPANKPKNDQQYKTDYLALVDHFLGLSTKPTVYVAFPLATGTNPCCSIRGDVIYEQQIPLIKQVAMEKHVPIIDLNTDTTNHPEYFGDGVHPNDAGYLVMAQLVKKGLEREPTVSITSPTMSQMLGAGMIPLTADASADTVDIGSVEFFEGATSLGKVMAAPFTLNWQGTVGDHTITAKATDATLANKTSDPVMFSVKEGVAGAAGAGAGGAAAGAGGAGGMPAAAGAPSTGGSVPVGTAGTATAGAPMNAASPTVEDAGCGCSLPGSRGRLAAAWLLLAALPLLRRRRAA